MKPSKQKTRILIADDHTIVRMGLVSLLGTEKDMEVVGQAKNGSEAVQTALKTKPDVVIMDLVMPKMDGVEATVELQKALPSARILVLTTFGTSDGIAHALASGASGALIKSAENLDLITAIRQVAAGRRYLSPEIAEQLKLDPPVPELTPRQKDILALMIRGFTNRDIANQLSLSTESVNEYVNAILQKVGAANRTEAVAIALRKHLLKSG